ncbi:MAG: FecR domain-containing protein [Pseudomonadota bacterium]
MTPSEHSAQAGLGPEAAADSFPDERAAMLREAHEWRYRLQDPALSDADREAFERWRSADPRHEDLYDHAVTFHHALGTLTHNDLDHDVLRPSLRERLAELKARLRRWAGRDQFGLAAVGTAMVLAVVSLTLFSGAFSRLGGGEGAVVSASHETALGETRRIVLDDGSVLTLGAASRVETVFSGQERSAQLLAGSAFFEVRPQPERPFRVEAGDLQLRVVGTVFDVTRSSEVTRVAVAEGEVAVSFPTHIAGQRSRLRTSESLTMGQQVAASADTGLSPVRPINPAAIGAWRKDRLFYDGARLSEMVADANRYSNARVVIEGDVATIGNYQVRGSFNARDIDGMLSTLPEVFPLTIDRSEPGLIRILARDAPSR